MGLKRDRKLGNLEYCWAKMDAFAPVVFTGVLHLTGGPAAKAVADALKRLQASQPLLRAAIVPDGHGFRFALHEPAPAIPLTCMVRQAADQWQRVVETEVVTGFAPEAAPLVRCTYLMGDTDSDLLLSFHHSIIDNRSGVVLVDQLLRLCAGLATDGRAAASAGQHVLAPIDGLLPAGFRGMRKFLQTAGFVARQMKAELGYRARLGDRQAIHTDRPHRCRILSAQLSGEATHRLSRVARRRRLPLNAVLQSAMLIALARAKYRDQAVPMRGISFADLRPFLDPPPPSGTLGVYITMLQYEVDMTPVARLWQVAAAVSDQIYRAAKGVDKFAAAVMSKYLITFLIKRRSMRMGMVALSYPGALPLAPVYDGIRLRGLSGFISNNPLGPELAGFAKIVDRRLSLDLQYLDTDMDGATAGAIMADIMQMLDAARSDGDD